MLNKVAGKLAKKLAECSDADKEEIYIYGLELIISTFFGLISILVISCLLSCFTSGLVFISVFVPLRLFIGGYHAATYSKCFVFSNISYLIVLLVRDITLEVIPIWIWSFLLIGMCCYIESGGSVDDAFLGICESIIEMKDEGLSESQIMDAIAATPAPASMYDMWGKLTDSEKALVVTYPKEALAVQSNATKATNSTISTYGYNGNGDVSDAYRHGYWNALNARNT